MSGRHLPPPSRRWRAGRHREILNSLLQPPSLHQADRRPTHADFGKSSKMKRQRMSWIVVLVAAHFLTLAVSPSSGINCYTCSSVNGSEVNCEDPFNPDPSWYKEKCMVPKQGHVGVFPANFCIKIRGTNVETNVVTFIRACAMKTMDSQCGVFKYQDATMTGCILTCDYAGCNSASAATATAALAAAALLLQQASR